MSVLRSYDVKYIGCVFYLFKSHANEIIYLIVVSYKSYTFIKEFEIFTSTNPKQS